VRMSPFKVLGAALSGIVVSLLLVGLVSHTPVRHVIQVVPVALAFVAVARRTSWALDAALPVLLFWFFIMLLIWLWLLGLARIVTGTFAPVEIALTIAVGISCVAGFLAWLGLPSGDRTLARAAVFASFGLLQVAAMWLSLRPAFNAI